MTRRFPKQTPNIQNTQLGGQLASAQSRRRTDHVEVFVYDFSIESFDRVGSWGAGAVALAFQP